MLLSHGLLILAVAAAAATVEQTYEANGIEFDDCESAIRYAEASGKPVTVECHMKMHFGSDGAEPDRPAGPDALPDDARRKLRDYRQTEEFAFDDADASGVTFVSDEMLLITFQDSLEFRDLGGRLHRHIGSVEGDVEGLEYHEGRLIAVAEQGSTHIELTVVDTEVELVGHHPLPLRGIECVAYDPGRGEVLYGQEATGKLVNDKFETVFSFPRDLAACTVHLGELMVIVSHPWRQSVWYRLDMNSWSIIDEKMLPDGNWEGIACRNDKCVLVREASEKSGAAMVIFDSSAADRP
jgi:hypothetical protein